MVKNIGSHMAVLYPYPCYDKVCYKGTAIYMCELILLKKNCIYFLMNGEPLDNLRISGVFCNVDRIPLMNADDYLMLSNISVPN